MGSQLRKQNVSLEDDLEQNAYRFSFEMAAYTLEYGSDVSFGKNIAVNQAPFKTISINSFYLRGTEIEKVETIEGKKTIFIERLAITGLNAPLPTPYGELIQRRTREQDTAMAAFVNVFNSRLLGISYQISKRRYLNLQNHKSNNCMFVRSIAAFCGEDFQKMNRRLSRISQLLWRKEKSASGLESVITALFGFKTKVNQFQIAWTDIAENNRLDKDKIRLGINSGLGTKAAVANLEIRINLTHHNFDKIYQFFCSPEEKNELSQLKYIVKKYVGDFYICYAAVTPKTVPPLYLSSRKSYKPILGRSSWLPTNDTDNQKFSSAIIKL